MSRPLRHAKGELKAAHTAFAQMGAVTDFDSFEIQWRQFLDAIEKVWVKAERIAKGEPGFQMWQAPFKKHRADDPLLKYLYHARHVDQHSVAEILEHVPGRSEIKIEGPVAILNLEIRDGVVQNYQGSKPLTQTITPARVELVKVTNRGTECEPPEAHLGSAIPRGNPYPAASAALQFYEHYLTQLEVRFFLGRCEQPGTSFCEIRGHR
jgi:hypothetical protein